MTTSPALLLRAPDGGEGFSPYASETPPLAEHDYIQEEWIASGTEDGNPYATTLCVRRPRDAARFSGTVVVEPLHVHGISPVWLYTSEYLVRSGHAWVAVAAQKTTLDQHVKPSNPERYDDLDIEGPDSSDFDNQPQLQDPTKSLAFWSDLVRRNRATNAILAQVGAALRAPDGPFDGLVVEGLLLAGHSQTGSVVSYFVHEAHADERRADGASLYDGYFPSGFPYKPFHDIDVPIVQVMSEGDVSLPDYSFSPWYEARQYRRPDSDEPGDRYRLYELAGAPHMGTRIAPFNDVTLWEATLGPSGVVVGDRMNSIPHFELFGMTLDHLVRWVADGTVPPRAKQLEVADDGYFAADSNGNTLGGVRSAQMDVPHTRYHASCPGADGRPTWATVGTDEPFDAETLRSLYGDKAAFVERFDERVDELVSTGWLLAQDAADMRREAEQIDF